MTGDATNPVTPRTPRTRRTAANRNTGGSRAGSRSREKMVRAVIDGLLQIAGDDAAPVSARINAYSLLGRHFGLFSGKEEEARSDLADLMAEIADRRRKDAEPERKDAHNDEG